MTLQRKTSIILPALEEELQRQIRRIDGIASQPFYEMLTYHMGWNGEQTSGSGAGKRIRPLLMLLVVEASGGQWLRAISAAAAIEIVHNFSLVHDDIEDNSPTRRGRVTVWKKYGIPMAVNVGDALFAIANQALLDAAAHYPAGTVLRAAVSLDHACIELTRGQYLDMSYENGRHISEDDYWPMVDGKTAALLSASAEIGAILGGADDEALHYYSDFARHLGMAFQVRDDILGIWGDESATGKSAASDLTEGKNSLPILYGIGRNGAFARRWSASPITAHETSAVAQLLKDEGAFDYSVEQAEKLTELAMASLRAANPQGDAGDALAELARKLLNRKS